MITKNPSSFKDTLSLLKYLTNFKDVEIRIALDLIPQFLSDFDEVFEFLQDEKIRFDFVDLHRIAPIGSATKKRFSLSLEEYRIILKKMHDLKKHSNISSTFEDGLPLCLFDKKYWKYINTCKCGISKLWIDPWGDVRRCACSSGAIGNILEQSLSSIWSTKKLKDFRSFQWLPEECKDCKKLENCFGGCSSSRGVEFFDKDIFSDSFKSIQ